MMTNKFILSIVFLVLCSCSHNLKFSANHFAVPVTAEHQWGGHAAVSVSGTTTVTVIDDISADPPNRNKVLINERSDLTGEVFVARVGLNGALSLVPSLEAYVDSSIYGLRWQFLNHGPTPDQWVGAVQAGIGSTTQGSNLTDSSNTYSAESKINSKQFALSVGYKLPVGSLPYLSYVYEVHDAKTIVKRNSTPYPEYEDHGVHQSLAIGMASYTRGLSFAVEYAFLDIAWDRAARTGQGSLGGNIGFAW